MKKTFLCAALAALFLLPSAAQDSLSNRFSTDIPRSAYPQVWWHWMNGDVSKDGIKKDLLWMNRMGISGLHQFDAGGLTFGGREAEVPTVSYMSDEWKEAFRYAVSLVDSLGMEMTIASCPGWSSTGGPWVPYENAMKKLVWRTAETSGGCVQVTLPAPFTTAGTFQNIEDADDKALEPWYRDVALVAVRLPEAEKSLKELGAVISSSGGEFTVDMLSDGDLQTRALLPSDETAGYAWIQYEFPEPQIFKAVTLCAEANRSRFDAFPAGSVMTLQSSDDGVSFTDVAAIPESVINSMTVDIPPTKAKYFRLKVQNPTGGGMYAAYYSAPPAPGREIREFVLHCVEKVNHAEERGAFAAQHDFLYFKTPDSSDPAPQTIVLDNDLPEGECTLSLDLPEGRWRIYRFGQTLTGKQNHPATPDATGLEVDKLDPEAWMDFFRKYVDMYKEASGGQVGQHGIQYLLTDSYEAQQMTWTRNMASEFEARCGYSLYGWLPALTGQIISSTDETERFLWDWRRVIGDLFKENYDRINDIVAEYGMKGRYTEAQENGRVYVGDGMDVRMSSTVPMAAIWMPTPGAGSSLTMAQADIKEAASVAHIYGQNIAAAESFTSAGFGGRAYSFYPGNLKYVADVALSAGLNRFVIHESAHQPSDERVPGNGLFVFGQWFNRHETWAEYARPWMDYLARSCYMLQQGRYVADIAYLYGEDACVTGLYGEEGFPDIPNGYSFDFINPKGVLGYLEYEDGRLVTPSGMSYSVLVLGGNCEVMSLELLRKIAALAKEGALIQGIIPRTAASLSDDQTEFDALVKEIWHSGLPNVSTGDLGHFLEANDVKPDFHSTAPGIVFVHRATDKEDIYWVCNFSGENADALLTLRDARGSHLSVWDPESGKTRQYVKYIRNDCGSVTAALNLPVDKAVFLVCDDYKPEAEEYFLEIEVAEITSPWTVTFQEGRGAPASAEFATLASYTESEDPGIRYFSGVATYGTSLTLNAEQLRQAESFVLELGDVQVLAKVSVNGHDCGTAWRAPYKVDVPASCLKKGENKIEVTVVNLWPNRIIGDEQAGAERITHTPASFYSASSPLLPSGLLGPVRLVKYLK